MAMWENLFIVCSWYMVYDDLWFSSLCAFFFAWPWLAQGNLFLLGLETIAWCICAMEVIDTIVSSHLWL